jgi:hypothetical protein
LIAAQAASAAEICSGVPGLKSAPALQPSLMMIKAPKLAFAKGSETKGCPGPGPECATRRVAPEGETVVVVGEAPGYVCAVYTTGGAKTTTTFGFLPKSGLAPASPSPVNKAAEWFGKWNAGPEQTITIGAAPKGIAIEGSASWGASDPERARKGAVNTGEISATLAVDGASLAFTMGEDDETLPLEPDDESYSCGMKMWRLGPYLVASDNGNCGGHNVTFSGAYRR